MTSSLQAVEAEREAELKLREARRRMWMDRITSLGALILLIVVASATIPSFHSPINIINVARQTCVNALLASGQTFVILTAGIDLSIGSILAVVGVTAVALMDPDTYNWSPWAASLAGIAVCLFVGLLIGFWVIGWKNPALERRINRMAIPSGFRTALIKITSKSPVPPFIVTLSFMLILRGVALGISQGQPRLAPVAFGWLGQGDIGGIPVPVYVTVIVYAICYFVLTRTKFGRSVYAIGGNEEVARLSGININRVKLGVYALCSTLAGLAGVVLASRLGSGQVNVGQGDELNAIAAVVIGGTSLMGGEGGIWGTLIGALIIAILLNVLNLLGVQAFGQYVARGLVILVAVYIDSSLRR
jgi:ribose transport system permease protein